MRGLPIVAVLLLIGMNASAEAISYLDVPFRSVDYSVGSTSSFIYFKSVVISASEATKDVSANVNEVAVVLKEDSPTYTTISIFNARKDSMSGEWLMAERVVVTVSQSSDLAAWHEFLSRVKRKQELERKRMLEPTRVLPPIDSNGLNRRGL